MNNYNEFERSARHKACIYLALETLVICFFSCRLVVNSFMDGWGAIYFHDSYPIVGIMLLIMFVAMPIIFTIGAMYSKGVYIACEIIHCVIGGLIILIGFTIFFLFGILALIALMILMSRFWKYRRELKEYREYYQNKEQHR